MKGWMKISAFLVGGVYLHTTYQSMIYSFAPSSYASRALQLEELHILETIAKPSHRIDVETTIKDDTRPSKRGSPRSTSSQMLDLASLLLPPLPGHVKEMSSKVLPPQKMNVASTTQIPSNTSDLEFHDEKLVLALIAFGNATAGSHVQRVIRSARARGKWKGRIAIITDSKDAYQKLSFEDPLVHVLHPRSEDWEAMPDFVHSKMKIKRFKALLLDYVLADPRLDDAEFVLYLDIDIVICQPLSPWIQAKWQKGAKRRDSLDGMSTMSMFREGKTKGLAGHSGLILLHRDLSQGCLLKWRELFDQYRDKAPRDQWLVRMIRRAPKRMNCTINTWWPHKQDFLFPEPRDLKKQSLPQFVHITNTFRAQWIDAELQKAFLENALMLSPEEKQHPNSLAVVPKNF